MKTLSSIFINNLTVSTKEKGYTYKSEKEKTGSKYLENKKQSKLIGLE